MATLPLRHIGYIDLPEHRSKGGFDHAAVHAPTGLIYVAHTANDAVDVLDPRSGKYAYSIPGLTGVAGVLISDDLIVSSNRGENTIGLFAPGPKPEVAKIDVGVRPNGLAFDPQRGLILVAHAGDPAVPGSYTLAMVDAEARRKRTDIPVAGRTKWTIYDPDSDAFYVNISDPPEIAVVGGGRPDGISTVYPIPAAGPHGLDIDLATRRLFCACDAGMLVTLDATSGRVLDQRPLSGVPDVVWFNAHRHRLYVAVGDPGVIDVFDTRTLERLGSVPTEKGAHTTAIAPAGDRIYAFLPATHRAAIYEVI